MIGYKVTWTYRGSTLSEGVWGSEGEANEIAKECRANGARGVKVVRLEIDTTGKFYVTRGCEDGYYYLMDETDIDGRHCWAPTLLEAKLFDTREAAREVAALYPGDIHLNGGFWGPAQARAFKD